MPRRTPRGYDLESPDSDDSLHEKWSPESPSYERKKYKEPKKSSRTPASPAKKSSRRPRSATPDYSVSSSIYPPSSLVPPRHEERSKKTGARRERARESDREDRRAKSARTPKCNPYSFSPDDSPVKKKSTKPKRSADREESRHVRIDPTPKSPRRPKQETRHDDDNTAADYMAGKPAKPAKRSTKTPYLEPIRTNPPMMQYQQQQQPPQAYSPHMRPPLPQSQESILHLSNSGAASHSYYHQPPPNRYFQQETSYARGPYLSSPNTNAGPNQTNFSNSVPSNPPPYNGNKPRAWLGALKNPFDDSNQANYGQLTNDPFQQAQQQNEKQPEEKKKPKRSIKEWWATFKHKKLLMWAGITALAAVVIAVGMYFAITKSTEHKKAGSSVTNGATQQQSTGTNTGSTANTNTNANSNSNIDPAIAQLIAPPTKREDSSRERFLKVKRAGKGRFSAWKARDYDIDISSGEGLAMKRDNNNNNKGAFSAWKRDVDVPADGLSLVKRDDKKGAFSAWKRDDIHDDGSSTNKRDEGKGAFSAWKRDNVATEEGLSMVKRSEEKGAFSAWKRKIDAEGDGLSMIKRSDDKKGAFSAWKRTIDAEGNVLSSSKRDEEKGTFSAWKRSETTPPKDTLSVLERSSTPKGRFSAWRPRRSPLDERGTPESLTGIAHSSASDAGTSAGTELETVASVDDAGKRCVECGRFHIHASVRRAGMETSFSDGSSESRSGSSVHRRRHAARRTGI